MNRWLVCLLLVALATLTAPAYAATQEHIQFKMRIVPLDCTIDVIDYGYGPIQVITCPPDPEPPTPPPTPLPPPTPTPSPVPVPTPQVPRALTKEPRSDVLLDKLYAGNLLGGAGFMLRIDNGAQTSDDRGGAAPFATGILLFVVALLAILQAIDLLRGGPGFIPIVAHRWRRKKKSDQDDTTDEL